MASKGGGARKIGSKAKKPAFKRYKASDRAAERKVKNLMRQNGMTESEALAFRYRQMADAAANPKHRRKS